MLKQRPYYQAFDQDSVSNYNINKLKSTSSLAVNKMDTERAVQFNSDLKKKISYEWKNVYRSLVQSDVL